MNLSTTKIEVFINAIVTLSSSFVDNPTPEQNATYYQNIELLLSAIDIVISSQPGLNNFRNNSVVVNDLNNIELFEVLSQCRSESKSTTVKTGREYFSTKCSRKFARLNTLIKDASNRAVAKSKKTNMIPI